MYIYIYASNGQDFDRYDGHLISESYTHTPGLFLQGCRFGVWGSFFADVGKLVRKSEGGFRVNECLHARV